VTPTSLLPDTVRYRWARFVDRRRAAWWQRHAGTSRSFLFELQPGVRIRLHLDSELCRLLYTRHFEMTERLFANLFLRPGDTFVDVGANVGVFTLIAASRVGATGRVVAFEPTPATFQRLNENIRTNGFGNVEAHELALSDEIGNTVIATATDGLDAWNSLAVQAAGPRFSESSTRTVTWDQFSDAHQLTGRATMMKIDVEGWECRVLEGARSVLSRPDAPTLQVEFTDAAARAAGSSCSELYATLSDLGYRMFLFDLCERTLVPDPLRSEYPYVNIIAAKDPEFVTARLRESCTTKPRTACDQSA
jgi:FkbM family methyltransferase